MPRKLQPVAGMRYLHHISDQSGRNYQLGFHISKYGDDDAAVDNSKNCNKRRSVTSLGSNPIYTSDGPSSPDLELSPKIYFNRDGTMEDFEIPPMYQELEEITPSYKKSVAPAGVLQFDPFQGVELPIGEDGLCRDVNNNEHPLYQNVRKQVLPTQLTLKTTSNATGQVCRRVSPTDSLSSSNRSQLLLRSGKPLEMPFKDSLAHHHNKQ